MCLYRYFLSGYPGAYRKHLIVIEVYFELITAPIPYKSSTFLFPTLYILDVTDNIFLYCVSITIFLHLQLFILLSLNFYTRTKLFMFQYDSILYFSIYLPLSVSFILSYAFVLLSTVLSFQLEGLRLAFLIRQV